MATRRTATRAESKELNLERRSEDLRKQVQRAFRELNRLKEQHESVLYELHTLRGGRGRFVTPYPVGRR